MHAGPRAQSAIASSLVASQELHSNGGFESDDSHGRRRMSRQPAKLLVQFSHDQQPPSCSCKFEGPQHYVKTSPSWLHFMAACLCVTQMHVVIC